MKINLNDAESVEEQVKKVILQSKEHLELLIKKETEILKSKYDKDLKAIKDKYSSIEISWTQPTEVKSTPKQKVIWNEKMLDLFKTYLKNSEVKNALKTDFSIDISESSVAYKRLHLDDVPKVKKPKA